MFRYVLLGMLLLPSLACKKQMPLKPPLAIFQTKKGEVQVQLEVVSTPEQIRFGLMNRPHLPPNQGMLFVFGSERVRTFWMKNTLIPLDMLFIRSDKSVAGIVRNTQPLTLDSRSVGIKTQYVLEVNAGWSEKHGVAVNSRVNFKNLPTISHPPL